MKEVHLLVQEAQVVRQEVLLQGIRVGDTRGIHSTEARVSQKGLDPMQWNPTTLM